MGDWRCRLARKISLFQGNYSPFSQLPRSPLSFITICRQSLGFSLKRVSIRQSDVREYLTITNKMGGPCATIHQPYLSDNAVILSLRTCWGKFQDFLRSCITIFVDVFSHLCRVTVGLLGCRSWGLCSCRSCEVDTSWSAKSTLQPVYAKFRHLSRR